jgi:hypothetical protein
MSVQPETQQMDMQSDSFMAWYLGAPLTDLSLSLDLGIQTEDRERQK